MLAPAGNRASCSFGTTAIGKHPISSEPPTSLTSAPTDTPTRPQREGKLMNTRPTTPRPTTVDDRRAVPVGGSAIRYVAGATVAAAFLSGASFLAPALAQARPIFPVPTACTTNGTPFPCPPPAPMPKFPPKPLQGPGVSWGPVLGGLVAHVTDRSGVASQCTYTADWYTRSFFLGAKATYDVVMVPAIPKLGTWDVTVSCDNGTATHTSTFF